MQTETQCCSPLASHSSPGALRQNVRVPGRDPGTFFTLLSPVLPIFAPKFPVSLLLCTYEVIKHGAAGLSHAHAAAAVSAKNVRTAETRLMSPARRQRATGRPPGPGRTAHPGELGPGRDARGAVPGSGGSSRRPVARTARRLPVPAAGGGSHAGPGPTGGARSRSVPAQGAARPVPPPLG